MHNSIPYSDIPWEDSRFPSVDAARMMNVLEHKWRRRRCAQVSPSSSSSHPPLTPTCSSSSHPPLTPTCSSSYNSSLSHHTQLTFLLPPSSQITTTHLPLPLPTSSSTSSLNPATSSYYSSYYRASSSSPSLSSITSATSTCLPVLSRRSCLLLLMLLLLLLPHLCCASWSYRSQHTHKEHGRGNHRRRHTDGSGHNHHNHHHHNAISRGGGSSQKDGDAAAEVLTAPYFDTEQTREVKAQLGSHAYLPCIIRDLGDKSVSWVRNSDKHILTVDRYTFISDNRFTARYEPDTETWTLQVKFISATDAGFYECQVSTEPKISHFVNLNVIIPRVSVPGGSELYVRSGSTVTVKCVISNALHPPNYVFWYHESSRVVGGGTLPGVLQEPLETLDNGVSVSSLQIATASAAHAGNYTCSPAHLTPTSVVLHVLNGEHPAAMQHGTSSGTLCGMGHVGVAGWMAPLLLIGLLHHRYSIIWTTTAYFTAALLQYITVQR